MGIEALRDINRMVVADVQDERAQQNRRFGMTPVSREVMMSVLVEEVGEVAKEINDYRKAKNTNHLNLMRQELVQVAAVAVKMIEMFDLNLLTD